MVGNRVKPSGGIVGSRATRGLRRAEGMRAGTPTAKSLATDRPSTRCPRSLRTPARSASPERGPAKPRRPPNRRPDSPGPAGTAGSAVPARTPPGTSPPRRGGGDPSVRIPVLAGPTPAPAVGDRFADAVEQGAGGRGVERPSGGRGAPRSTVGWWPMVARRS